VERQPRKCFQTLKKAISVVIAQQMDASEASAVTGRLVLALAGRLLPEKANGVAARRPLGVKLDEAESRPVWFPVTPSKSQSGCNRRSVSQCVLVLIPMLGLMTRYLLRFDSC
jgi:hypothetical protein